MNGIDVQMLDGAFQASKKPIILSFELLKEDVDIETKEGIVSAQADRDIIMTGTKGECWPIPLNIFVQTYETIAPGKAYKKDLSIWAIKMTYIFSVKVSWSDSVLEGKIGDYLVEYGKDDYGIVDSEIFEETYNRKEQNVKN